MFVIYFYNFLHLLQLHLTIVLLVLGSHVIQLHFMLVLQGYVQDLGLIYIHQFSTSSFFLFNSVIVYDRFFDYNSNLSIVDIFYLVSTMYFSIYI
jgi:hypothetical protein